MKMPAIELNNINVTLRGEKVLYDVTATFNQGDFVGIIGPNGGGKTTLLKVILGLIKPDSGSVKLLGDLPKKNRHRLGYVPQYARFNFSFPISVLDVVLMGRLGSSKYFKYYNTEDKKIALGVLEKVGLLKYSKRQIGKLSGGEMQRVLIARALAVNPEVLLLDEPTASLDTPIGQEIYKLLEEHGEKICVILVSHDIGVISKHVKTIACLNRCLHYHQSHEISSKTLEEVYGCPVELIAHGHAHRVLHTHDHSVYKEDRED